MLCLTKIKRSYIIDHVMPSDLDDKDIKNGLYLKEQMLEKITDDYIKEKYPDWKELERRYRKNGLSDVIDKIMCGEATPDNFKETKPIRCEIWMRTKEFKEGEIIPKHRDPDAFERYETYDFDRLTGYSEWIKQFDDTTFELDHTTDIMIQFQLAIIGEYSIRYYPFQDATHYNGFTFVDDNIHIYNPQVWDRNDDGTLVTDISNQEEYYRLFFKNYKGYYTFEFEDDYTDWINANYPNEKVRTLQTDPMRLKCDEPENPMGTYFVLSGQQWIKTNYITEVMNIATFRINIDKTINE